MSCILNLISVLLLQVLMHLHSLGRKFETLVHRLDSKHDFPGCHITPQYALSHGCMSLNLKMYSWFGINWTQIGTILSPRLTHVYLTYLTMVNINGKRHTLFVYPSIYGFWLPLWHLQSLLNIICTSPHILNILLINCIHVWFIIKWTEVLLELLIKPILKIEMCGTRLDGSTVQII